MADNSTGMLTRRGKHNPPKPLPVKEAKNPAKRRRKTTKPPPTLPPLQLPTPPSLPSLPFLPPLWPLLQPLPLPPPYLSMKLNVCTWANEGGCQFANFGHPPEPCHRLPKCVGGNSPLDTTVNSKILSSTSSWIRQQFNVPKSW